MNVLNVDNYLNIGKFGSLEKAISRNIAELEYATIINGSGLLGELINAKLHNRSLKDYELYVNLYTNRLYEIKDLKRIFNFQPIVSMKKTKSKEELEDIIENLNDIIEEISLRISNALKKDNEESLLELYECCFPLLDSILICKYEEIYEISSEPLLDMIKIMLDNIYVLFKFGLKTRPDDSELLTERVLEIALLYIQEVLHSEYFIKITGDSNGITSIDDLYATYITLYESFKVNIDKEHFDVFKNFRIPMNKGYELDKEYFSIMRYLIEQLLEY